MLEAYGRAYRQLVKKTEDYYTTLGGVFASEDWIKRVGAQSKELATEFGRVKTKADGLVASLGGKLYVDKLQETLAEKGKYEAAWDAWNNAPWDAAKSQALDSARTAYYNVLRDAYAKADGFAAYPEAVGKAAQEAEAIVTSLKAVQTKLKDPPLLGKFAEDMRLLQQKQAAEMATVFAAAEAAAKAAGRAGAKLAEKPEAPSTAKNVVILDALYGESRLMAHVMSRWDAYVQDTKKKGEPPTKAGSLKDFLPWNKIDTSGKEVLAPFCYASDYVKASCLYTESRERLCLHKDGKSNPLKLLEPPALCGGDYDIPMMSRERTIKDKVTSCTFNIYPDTICGGLTVNVSAAKRHALILYRCGSDDPVLLLASSSKKVYLFCD